MNAAKNILIVYAHQEPKSFNGALKDAAVATFSAQGHDVTVSDLCQLKFDPVDYPHYFKERINPDHFDATPELTHAALNNLLPEHIANELDKIKWADLIILQFPMYWFGFPAILKGWFDMCIIDQVAVDICKTKWMDNGLFKGKKLLISMTTGAKHAAFTSFGDHGDIDVYMWPLMMPFRFCGFAVLPPQIFYEVQQVSHERRTEMLTSWKERLETIFNETPLSFVHIENFGRDAILKTEVLESQSENEEGFNIAQHMGKRVPNGRKVEL